MSLETGLYNISSVSYVTRPPVVRPLGPSRTHGDPHGDEVVVLPLGSPSPIWFIEKLANGNYLVNVDDLNARVLNGSLRLSREKLPPFEWTVLRGAPSPPPIGTNNFGIIVPGHPQPQQSWLIPSTEGDQAVEVPVKIGGVASSIFILAAHHD